jgi:hypothetical protein
MHSLHEMHVRLGMEVAALAIIHCAAHVARLIVRDTSIFFEGEMTDASIS